MIRRAQLRLLALGTIAIGVAACSSDSSTGPASFSVSDTQISQDIAADAGDAIAGTADVMVTSEAEYDGGSADVGGGASASVNVSCTGPNSTGWYTCARTNERGLAVNRSIRFWNGNSYGLWFSAQTDSVNHAITAMGTLTPTPARTIWANRADSLTMNVTRGANPARTWVGHGARTDSSHLVTGNGSRDYSYVANDTVASVKFDVPRSSNPYPASGSFTYSATATLNATRGTQTYSRTVTRRAVVTFNGTENVTLVVGALTCSLDLATHVVTDCH